jgi:hypothetical protein
MAFNGAKSADYAMEALSQGFAVLKVKEITQQSKWLSQPALSVVPDFKLLGRSITKCTVHSFHNKRRESSTSFGIPPIVMARIWEMSLGNGTSPNPKMRKKHFLWGLHFLKVYPEMKII